VLALATACAAPLGDREPPREQVVLLHGLGRSSRSMTPLAKQLEASGFGVVNLGYASTKRSVAELTRELRVQVSACCLARERPLHFVAHSLGAILVRAYLDEGLPANLGRVVMLSPPNKGSELADLVGGSWLVEATLGPAVGELGTDRESAPNRLGPADFEVGIITGSRSWHPVGPWLIAGPDDGVVSVESARLEGMTDFLVVPRTHTFIMQDEGVGDEVVRFLRTGRFSHAAAASR
jgi:pimeloyl-ACP methyl ester carboxylesterase